MAISSPDTARRGRTTRSKAPSSTCWCLNISRTSRFSRLRSTARRAMRVPTTIPSRAKPWPLTAACTRKRSLRAARRERRTVPKAAPTKRERRRKISDRKPFAALRTATIEDFTATQSLHSGPKAMRTRSANLRGLVGAFHVTKWRGAGKSLVLDGGLTLLVNCPRPSGRLLRCLWITYAGLGRMRGSGHTETSVHSSNRPHGRPLGPLP